MIAIAVNHKTIADSFSLVPISFPKKKIAQMPTPNSTMLPQSEKSMVVFFFNQSLNNDRFFSRKRNIGNGILGSKRDIRKGLR